MIRRKQELPRDRRQKVTGNAAAKNRSCKPDGGAKDGSDGEEASDGKSKKESALHNKGRQVVWSTLSRSVRRQLVCP